MDWRDRSLFDVEDVLRTNAIKSMTVESVTGDDVDEFCRRYHYTGLGGNKLWRWGLWDGPVLHGVIAYNLPTLDVCEGVFGPEHYQHVWHMGRLAMSERTPRNGESRLIGGSLRAIRVLYPHVWAVVTYAASELGHVGYVYQATNALYTGTGGDPVYFLDETGGRHSTYLSGHVDDERAAALGWTKRRGGPKHRYVYLLGSRTQRQQRRDMLRWDVLPYPKSGEES